MKGSKLFKKWPSCFRGPEIFASRVRDQTIGTESIVEMVGVHGQQSVELPTKYVQTPQGLYKPEYFSVQDCQQK